MKERVIGDVYRPVVTVLKARRGLPTKIKVSGQEYALVHRDHANGNVNKIKGEKE